MSEPAPFQAPFSLALPEGTRDVSTYCFVLPSERTFSPTVVVKRDALEPEQTLLAYLELQAARLAAELPEFELEAAPAPIESSEDVSLTCLWGAEPSRYWQVLRATPAGEGALLLVTATAQPDATEDAVQALLAVASSVRSEAP